MTVKRPSLTYYLQAQWAASDTAWTELKRLGMEAWCADCEKVTEPSQAVLLNAKLETEDMERRRRFKIPSIWN